jgi:hypothetical protein
MPRDIVRVRLDLTGNRPSGIVFELTVRELATIGELRFNGRTLNIKS